MSDDIQPRKRLSKLQIAGFAIVGFIAISLLGGSAMWRAMGFGDDLSIDGVAETVRPAPAGLGQGWTAYGGDSGGNRYSAASQITH